MNEMLRRAGCALLSGFLKTSPAIEPSTASGTARTPKQKRCARNFSESPKRRADVRGELRDGVSDIWDRWNWRVDDTTAKCTELANGKD